MGSDFAQVEPRAFAALDARGRQRWRFATWAVLCVLLGVPIAAWAMGASTIVPLWVAAGVMPAGYLLAYALGEARGLMAARVHDFQIDVSAESILLKRLDYRLETKVTWDSVESAELVMAEPFTELAGLQDVVYLRLSAGDVIRAPLEAQGGRGLVERAKELVRYGVRTVP